MGEQQRTDHDLEAEEARASGDPARIKALYDSYGKGLMEQYGDRPEEIVQHGSNRVATWQASNLPRLAPEGIGLDLGCGPRPEVSIQISRTTGRRIVCADISYETVAIARRIAEREGAKTISAIVVDGERLPFRDGAFAMVTADDVIEHVPDPGALVVECGRVVRDDGVVSISTPNRRAVSVLVDRLKDLARGTWGPKEKYFLVPSHLWEFTRKELRTLSAPSFAKIGFVALGWDEDGVRGKKLATAVTERRPFHGLCRHWVMLLRAPRRRAQSR